MQKPKDATGSCAGIHDEQLLAPLQPSESALTPLFQANIDEAMLRETAAADYDWKADECYALLQPIWKTGLAASDDFNLREVLESAGRSLTIRSGAPAGMDRAATGCACLPGCAGAACGDVSGVVR